MLTVKPGEVVTIDTICGVPEMLERLGAATDEPIREMKQMYAERKGPWTGAALPHRPAPAFRFRFIRFLVFWEWRRRKAA